MQVMNDLNMSRVWVEWGRGGSSEVNGRRCYEVWVDFPAPYLSVLSVSLEFFQNIHGILFNLLVVGMTVFRLSTASINTPFGVKAWLPFWISPQSICSSRIGSQICCHQGMTNISTFCYGYNFQLSFRWWSVYTLRWKNQRGMPVYWKDWSALDLVYLLNITSISWKVKGDQIHAMLLVCFNLHVI